MDFHNNSVDEGFRPHFTEDFLERYGQKSNFIFAVSDWYTKAVAHLLEARGY